MSDLTPEKLAELQRLLDAATPRPWEWTTDLDALLGGEEGEYRVIDTALALRSYYVLRVAGEDAALIAAAVNALPALLDAATELAHMTEARDNARAEVERLTGQIKAAKRIGLSPQRGRLWVDVIDDVLRALDGGAES